MKPLLLLPLLLICSVGWACESFEECMEKEHTSPELTSRYAQVRYQTRFLQAIAYKLDEISKQLAHTKSECGGEG